MTNFKLNVTVVSIFTIAALLLFNVWQCNTNRNLVKEQEKTNHIVEALLDTVKVYKDKNGKSVYTQKVPEGSIDDIINSPAFKTLSAERQAY